MSIDFFIVSFLLLLFFNSIQTLQTKSLQFTEPLQRFVYDPLTDTILLASVNHLYSLNASDFSILSDVKTSPTENDQPCPTINNRTTLSSVSSLYAFPSSTYLSSYALFNHSFNQILLLTNQSVLICSTSNRGGSCQLRTLIHLNLLKNSSQRVVSSSPFYPSIGLISQSNGVLYTANTYDSHCDPFYEIPTMAGRSLEKDFLSIINLNSGQSALQQSTYTLRLLNNRLIKDFFLHYLYGFEHGQFTYFLTIQQSDLHHTRTHKLQTKLIRFCQTLQQPMIKTYVEIPLTCGHSYHYLVRAKFDPDTETLVGIFRNTTLATAGNTSHAVCSYTIQSIREAFFQTIKRCLVDGKGHRGLGYITPDTHCISNKNINDINHDYCPENDDSFFQYPIGGHRPLEQLKPIIEFHEPVNFTAIESISIDNDLLLIVGDDHGTVRMFQTSDLTDIRREKFPSSIVLDLQLIKKRPLLRHSQLLILTNDQIIRQNLSVCEQYSTCDACTTIPLCHWCAKEKRCAATFECANGNVKKSQQIEGLSMCTTIERVRPEIISIDSSINQVEVVFNRPWNVAAEQYKCQYQSELQPDRRLYTDILQTQENSLTCSPPFFTSTTKAVQSVFLSIYHVKTNLSLGHYQVSLINCSNFLSCSSCTAYSNFCLWNLQTVQCQDKALVMIPRKRWINSSDQCPHFYLKQSINRLPYNTNQTLTVHIEQCDHVQQVDFCQLSDNRKRLSFISSDASATKLSNTSDLCLLKCSFSFTLATQMNPSISFHRPLHLNLSVQLSNETVVSIPRTHISLYQCERMALNCTSCLQLDPSFGCIWCNNMCMLKAHAINQQYQCPNHRECLNPVIHSVEPMSLPVNGGTIVTIKGKNFDLFNLSVLLADVPCRVIEEDSSTEQIFCQTGDAQGIPRTGPVQLKFGNYGPVVHSSQTVSYVNPTIQSIEPLVGLESGGTLLTIQGSNLSIGNGHLSILIGSRPCQLVSISANKIQCETSSFLRSMDNENQSIKFYFDRQTKILAEQSFRVVTNPIIYSFDRHHPFRSFMSGGRQMIVRGENFRSAQNIRIEFQRTIFVSPIFHNDTHLIFLTPAIQELQINENTHGQHSVDLVLHLDHFNKTSMLMYYHDPLIYELEPMLQSYTTELTIYGVNLTALGHSTNEILVHIGCDLCPILHLQPDKLICQPPVYRPKKYSKNNRLCYDSEHPWIIVTIDNIHSHVGYMVYPKRLILLGVLAGCLVTFLLVILIVLIIVGIRIRCNQRKTRRRYLYGTGLKHHENDKDPYHDTLRSKTYQKLQPIEPTMTDSLTFPTVPLRSYVGYLQYSSYYHCHDRSSSYDVPKLLFKKEMIDQFQLLINNHEQFLPYFMESVFKSTNRKLLNSLLLMQRYQLKNFFHYNHDWIYFQICILTAYDGFLSNQITTLIFQLYHQLKQKIQSGPIDAIEPTSSYYSLNNQTILHDQSILFHPIQLIVHLDCQNADDLILIHVTCLTCDTISQVKEKILHQFYLYQSASRFSIDDCQLYLLTPSKSNPNSCSTSSCASSTTSSNTPIAKKSLLTQFFSHRSMKYSTTTTTTTTLNDSYRDPVVLLLNDLDQSNEQMNHCKKLNTLQHYGILHDGYELKMILPKINHLVPHSPHLTRTIRSNYFDCQYCSSDREKLFTYLTSLPTISTSIGCAANAEDLTRYCHLLNHTYEEIGECGHLLMDNNHSETYRLFETKSIIHPILINLIETLFNNFLHSDSYLSELIEQHPRFLHLFYGHYIPFLLQHLDCLFTVPIEPSVKSSFEILATIFDIACANQPNERRCLLCHEASTDEMNSTLNIQNCTLLFADEIQRVRLHYANVERRLNNKNSSSEYSSTNTGINRVFEIDPSIIHTLIEYACVHAEEISELLRNRSADENTLIQYHNLVHLYRSTGRT